MALKVQHGGWVRASYVVKSSETTYWSKGLVLQTNSDGEVQVHDGNATGVVGLALEDRLNTTYPGPDVTSVETTPSGEQAAMLVDTAFVEADDQLASGITFAAGDLVYTDSSGKLTTASTVDRVLGVAQSAAIANAGDSLSFLFSVQY